MFPLQLPSHYTSAKLVQDIAPTYYDISTFPKGDIRSALMRAAERLARKEKMRAEKRR